MVLKLTCLQMRKYESPNLKFLYYEYERLLNLNIKESQILYMIFDFICIIYLHLSSWKQFVEISVVDK